MMSVSSRASLCVPLSLHYTDDDDDDGGGGGGDADDADNSINVNVIDVDGWRFGLLVTRWPQST